MNLKQAFRIFATLLLGGLAFTPSAFSESPIRLRVLSYNIHHAEGTDGKLDLERIAKVIRSVEPDLVALQEVDRNTVRSGGVDQPAELGKRTGLAVVFERNIEHQGGDYGNAVLSRLPILGSKNHALPSHDQGEQRGVLEVVVEGPNNIGRLTFLATHLDHRKPNAERMASAKLINELVSFASMVPAILAGDLNAEPHSEVLDIFSHSWKVARTDRPAPTIPAGRPNKQIDFILARPAANWNTIEVRVLDEPVASDHRPILVVLELNSASLPPG